MVGGFPGSQRGGGVGTVTGLPKRHGDWPAEVAAGFHVKDAGADREQDAHELSQSGPAGPMWIIPCSFPFVYT